MKQETIEAEGTKYFPIMLSFEVLAIFAAPRKRKLMDSTASSFRLMKAKIFVWVRVANTGLTSMAPLLDTPTTVVSKSAAPRRSRVEQMIV